MQRLTEAQKQGLAEFIGDGGVRTGGRARRSIDLVYCPFFALEDLESTLSERGFRVLDCELFRASPANTDEFFRLVEWDRHDAFALLVPWIVPKAICNFLDNIANDEWVSIEPGTPRGTLRAFAEKRWLLVMTPEDVEGAVLEHRPDSYSLKRAIGGRYRLDW